MHAEFLLGFLAGLLAGIIVLAVGMNMAAERLEYHGQLKQSRRRQ
jgi:hypothetical protein